MGDLLTAMVWMTAVQIALAAPLPTAGNLAVGLLLILAFLAFVFRPSEGLPPNARPRRFRFVRPRPGITVRLIPAVFGVGAIHTGMYALIADGDPPGTIQWTALLLSVVAAPIIEEAVFRGSLQQRLERQWGPHRAVLSVALVFAALHLNPLTAPAQVISGLVYGYAAYLSGSVWPAIALHATGNLLLLSLLPYQHHLSDLPSPQAWTLMGAGFVLLGLLARTLAESEPPPRTDTRVYLPRTSD